MLEKKILIVGDWAYDIYEAALYNAFLELGCNVDKYSYGNFFHYANHPSIYKGNLPKIKELWLKFQYKYRIGPVLYDLNIKLINIATQYDVVFLYRCVHIFPKTLEKIKRLNPQIKIVCYNNDDPFSKDYSKYVWRNYFACLKWCDTIYSFREKNIQDYKKLEIDAKLLRAYYRKQYNYPILESNKSFDVVFIGHFENDGRDKYVYEILKAGINIQIFGPRWEQSGYYDFFQKNMKKIVPQYGKDYNKCINESKIALVFLSKKNNDTYTRRNFEIPATRTFMLSEFSDDLNNNLFKKDFECGYFRNEKDCVEQIKYYLSHEKEREEIASNGHIRNKENEVIERAKFILTDIYQLFLWKNN
ncbi:MAG: glycosyltransferase [Bacteroidales bacterium]|jgi:spore maturation protein CgeB|nr:glycosyltransferase [Bacteroidales bacterium]